MRYHELLEDEAFDQEIRRRVTADNEKAALAADARGDTSVRYAQAQTAKRKAESDKKWDEIEAKQKVKYSKKEDLLKGIALIKRDCQPFLQQVRDPMTLRRGVSRNYADDKDMGRPMFSKKQAHLKDRRTKAMNHGFASFTNRYFKEEFGKPFRNAIMTTGDQMHASIFGTDVAVFPIGPFRFLWSPNVTDLNYDIVRMAENRDYPIDAAITFSPSLKGIYYGLEDAAYQDTDLQSAINSKHEIMIWAEEYYTLDNQVDRMLARKMLK